MSVHTINGRTVAVCIAQPALRLVMPDDQIIELASTPLLIDTSSNPAPTVLGFDGQRPPTYTAASRALTDEELAADAIFVPLVDAYVPILRAAYFRGQVLTPGVIRPAPDGKLAAHHSTVTVLADADPLLGYDPSEIVVGPGGQTLEQAAAAEQASVPR